MAARPISEHTTEQLQNLIHNYRKNTTDPVYLAALDELARRKGQGLSFSKSLELIRTAAAERRCLSYKQIAEGSGVEWSKVRYAISGHLDDLLKYAHGKGWPMLTAIVVNQENLSTGRLEPQALAGFVKGAAIFGCPVTDREQFLKE
ncbi:hypothetical protein [Mesorhizobium sp.]|uniref:hypothetical protein n=1 Tax=Mesorhizobium sp. TaxID=1871066 RepID=UPI000FE7B19D|nr:hypothetical protein [Mesorhizobium sp.]RWM07978.1 MAG: hypothetical protein EOR71_14580 [Mesorhizobium sp.]